MVGGGVHTVEMLAEVSVKQKLAHSTNEKKRRALFFLDETLSSVTYSRLANNLLHRETR